MKAMNEKNEKISIEEMIEKVKMLQETTSSVLKMEKVGTWLWISCPDLKNDVETRNKLKDLGFHYARNKAKWYYHQDNYARFGKKKYSYEEIKLLHGCEKVD